MKIVHIKNPESREACLAELCASVYGQDAGLAPLVTFAGTLRVLFEQDAARLFALTDDERNVLSLVLLATDVEGSAMEVAMLSTPKGEGQAAHSQQLIKGLAEKAPLRVTATDAAGETFFRQCGIERWLEGPGNLKIGLAPAHPEPEGQKLSNVVRFDGDSIAQTFKREPKTFETYKTRFVESLERFPRVTI